MDHQHEDDGDDDDRKPSSSAPLSDGESPPPAAQSTVAGREDDDNAAIASTIDPSDGMAYVDYSNVKPSDMREEDDDGDIHVLPRAKKEPTFIAKLHSILSNPAFEDIVSWLPHGRAWRVHQRRAFEEQVIPLYVRHGKYSSFMRQVNGWGFQRIYQGPDYNGYYHELFLRGMPHLANKMRRPSGNRKDKTAPLSSSAGKKVAQDSAGTVYTAPDFYKMAEKHPLPDIPTNPNSTSSGSSSQAVGQVLGATPTTATSTSTTVAMGNNSGIPPAYGENAAGGIYGQALNNNQFPNVNVPAFGANLLAPQAPSLWTNPAPNGNQLSLLGLPQNQLLLQALLAQQYQISQQQHILSSLSAPLSMAGTGLNTAAMLSLGAAPAASQQQPETGIAQPEGQAPQGGAYYNGPETLAGNPAAQELPAPSGEESKEVSRSGALGAQPNDQEPN